MANLAYAYQRTEIVASSGSVQAFEEWLSAPPGGWETADRSVLTAINRAG